MSELVFFTNPMSRGRTVRWMLEEVGQPYRTEVLEYGTTMKSPEYLAINPMGKVPALVHGDVVVTETAAICAYLADAFPQAGLAPASGSALRGAFYRWLFFAAGPLEMACVNHAAGLAMPADKEGMAGFGTLDLVLDTLEGAIGERRFLVGDAFSAADLFTGSMLGWLMGFGIIGKRAAFERYAGPLLQRPASVRAKEIDDGLMGTALH